MISYKMNNPIAGLRATSGESREMLRRLRKNRARALRVREKLSAQYGAVLLDGDGAEIGWIEAEIAQCDQYRTRGEAMIHELERRLSKGVAVEGGVFETSIEADPVARAVREIAAEGRWIGTATRLLELVRERVSPAPDDQTFPGAAHVLSGRLRRAAPSLRAVGVSVQMGIRRPGRERTRIIVIELIEDTPARPPAC